MITRATWFVAGAAAGAAGATVRPAQGQRPWPSSSRRSTSPSVAGRAPARGHDLVEAVREGRAGHAGQGGPSCGPDRDADARAVAPAGADHRARRRPPARSSSTRAATVLDARAAVGRRPRAAAADPAADRARCTGRGRRRCRDRPADPADGRSGAPGRLPRPWPRRPRPPTSCAAPSPASSPSATTWWCRRPASSRTTPTVLFTVAGMVPFKPYFLGDEVPPVPAGHRRRRSAPGPAASTTTSTTSAARTATSCFFEMLGNFSFGDYFKDEAIPGVGAGHRGCSASTATASGSRSTPPTTRPSRSGTTRSACRIERIQRLGDEDNFWQMGDTGPCGPCSEIFIDRGADYGPTAARWPTRRGERFVEFWNLVFMQYDQAPDGTRRRCPSRSIDTGAGLERILGLAPGRRLRLGHRRAARRSSRSRLAHRPRATAGDERTDVQPAHPGRARPLR